MRPLSTRLRFEPPALWRLRAAWSAGAANSAIQYVLPAARATTLLSPGGAFVWPEELSPQITTEPSERRARLLVLPAAMASTLLKPAGTVACLEVFCPQAAIVPSERRAR